jgi:UDP-GlcNAc:undecaprenyl-phosphate GlcNAc-1-phosphate transferase
MFGLPFGIFDAAVIALGFVLAVILTPLVRAAAYRRNIVAKPSVDRWHKRPTALLGGVAIFLAFTAVAVGFGPRSWEWLCVMVGSTFLFVVGLVDDLQQLRPSQKLIAQVLGASVILTCGLRLPWTGWLPLDMAITIVWLVGITNAVNLLDNMDGLAAGIGAIAATFLAVIHVANGQLPEAVMLAAFAAVLYGFLIYNCSPASIFMGDCGALFAGFFLAGSALTAVCGGRSRTLLPILAVPVLILVLPIFDTTLVTILRKLTGRAVSQGGRDHTSHRLVALGIPERRAVSLLWAFSFLSGLLALLVRELPVDVSIAAIGGFTVVLVAAGTYLAKVSVCDEAQVPCAGATNPFAVLIGLSCERRVFEVLFDLGLIILSYYVACLLPFGPLSRNGAWKPFVQVIPVLVAVKLATFLAMGVYRSLWRYLGIADLVLYAKAVVFGSALSALAVLFAFRFEGFSRVVFVLDAFILLTLLVASRVALRLFGRLLRPVERTGRRRVLIYGAGDGGELVLHELLGNRGLGCNPIGFVDDDPLKERKVIHGLHVFGGNGALGTVLREQQTDEVIISSAKFPDDRVKQIRTECGKANVTLRRMRIQMEEITEPREAGCQPAD